MPRWVWLCASYPLIYLKRESIVIDYFPIIVEWIYFDQYPVCWPNLSKTTRWVILSSRRFWSVSTWTTCWHQWSPRLKRRKWFADVRRQWKNGGFNLTKYVTSDYELLSTIDVNDRAEEVRDLTSDMNSRALGVKWDVNEDAFYYVMKQVCARDDVTRRIMLSNIATMYDPLRLITPIALRGKISFQEATRLKLDWDAPVPEDLPTRWRAWLMSLQSLDSLHFPRCVIPHAVADDVSELHFFCDASECAYGACAYIRTISVTGQVHVALLASKGRLAPIKPVGIPRLELTACLEAVELDVLIRREVDMDLIASTFQTDSQVALAYIHNDTCRFNTFVANRVARIRDTTSPGQWHHICGNDNPADVLSRGCDVNKVPELWFSGAGFLSDFKSTWPTSTLREYDFSVDVEVNAGSVFVADGEPTTVVGSERPHPVDRLATYYSSFYKLCKAVASLMRFKRFLQTKEIEQGHISSSELSRSRDAIVKVVQQSSYPEELHDIASKGCVSRSNRILKLSPMIADGILVVGGRLLHSALSCKRPPILPRDHPISRLIVRECHGASHLGTEWTLSNLRMRYWVGGARNVIKQVRRQYLVCKRLYAAPLDQRMADLSPERCLAGGTPFDVTGTDLFGPILVKVNHGQVKRWGCILTCFKSRTIHIEVLSSLEADSFINGFIRFVVAIWMSPIFILMRGVNLVKLVLRVLWLVVPSSGIMGNLSCWGLAGLSQISWAPNLTRVGRNPVGTMSQKDSMLFVIFL